MRRLDTPQTTCSFELDGQKLVAKPEELLAAAMWASGETVFARSPKYHRPRGPFCLTGECAGCLVRVDGRPNTFACQTAVKEGMKVERQNAFPSAKVDIFAATDWLFPKGFNHHEFLAGIPVAEQVMAKVARQLAGLGKLPDEKSPPVPAARVEQVDTLVVGAGPAGLGAAAALAQAGRASVLVERDDFVGGKLAWGAPENDAPALPGRVEGDVRLGTTVVGIYEDEHGRYAILSDGASLTKTYARVLILANGGHAALVPFDNNDLPGVLSSRAVTRFIRLHRILPGERVALVGSASQVAPLKHLIESVGGQAVEAGEDPLAAQGSHRVSSLKVARGTTTEIIDCDVIALCAPPAPAFELARQAGAEVAFDEAAQTFCVVESTPKSPLRKTLAVVGDARRPQSAADAFADGQRAVTALWGSVP